MTQALVKGARDRGARVHRHTRVAGLVRSTGGEWRIATDRGDFVAEIVVNAAGTWAREVGRLVGLDLPIVPMEHQYLVTEAIPEITALGRELPLLREVDVSSTSGRRPTASSWGRTSAGRGRSVSGGSRPGSARTSCRPILSA